MEDNEIVAHIEWLKNNRTFQILKLLTERYIQLVKENKEKNILGSLHTINNLLDDLLITPTQVKEMVKRNPNFYERLNEPLTISKIV